jgi:hypothetical protein
LRGATDELSLRSSYRLHDHPTGRYDNRGFRCVLVISGDFSGFIPSPTKISKLLGKRAGGG